MDDMETVARALCKYDADCQEMPVDEMWALYSAEYMRDAESSMAVLAPLFESKRESGSLAGYLDGLAQGKKDAQRELLTADMFWNSDDTEDVYNSIECFLNDRICNDGLDVGAVFTMLRAQKMSDVTIRVTAIDEDQSEAEYEVIVAAHGITKDTP